MALDQLMALDRRLVLQPLMALFAGYHFGYQVHQENRRHQFARALPLPD
jgi:hypothetical protein